MLKSNIKQKLENSIYAAKRKRALGIIQTNEVSFISVAFSICYAAQSFYLFTWSKSHWIQMDLSKCE